MIRRFVAPLGSALTLVGALAIGAAIHQTVVTGNHPVTSPVGVLGTFGGVVLVAGGYWLEQYFEPSDYVRDPEEGDEEDEGSDEFDEELSPISEEMLEGREADDSYDG